MANLPEIPRPTEPTNKQLANYIYGLEEQLRYVLNHLGAENLTEKCIGEGQIADGSITANKIQSDAGKSLDLSSNESVRITVQKQIKTGGLATKQELQTAYEQTEKMIALKANAKDVEDGTVPAGKVETTTVIIRANGINMKTGGTFVLESGNFGVDEQGNVYMIGKVTAGEGEIGGWIISPGNLSSGEGNDHVRLSTEDDVYAIWAGAENGDEAPFRVTKDGKLYVAQLFVTDENGVAQTRPVNLGANYWKMDKAYARAVQSLTVANDTLTIALNDGTSVNFKKAGFSALELRQGDPQGRGVWEYNPTAHTYNVQKTVYAYDNGTYIGLYSTVSETSDTQAYDEGRANVKVTSITRQAADNYTGGEDHGTTVYIRAAASNGAYNTQSFRVSGESAYSAGESAGHKAGYDEGKKDGYDEGEAAGYEVGYAAGYEAAKAAVTVEGWINSITNTAPNYYFAQGQAVAYVDGVQVASDTFGKGQRFG